MKIIMFLYLKEYLYTLEPTINEETEHTDS